MTDSSSNNNSVNNTPGPADPGNGNNGTATTPPPQTSTANGTTTWVGGNVITVTYDPNWINWNVPVIVGGDVSGEAPVKAKKKSEGCSCVKCKDFNEYAEPNQPDDTFMCYRCRKGL